MEGLRRDPDVLPACFLVLFLLFLFYKSTVALRALGPKPVESAITQRSRETLTEGNTSERSAVYGGNNEVIDMLSRAHCSITRESHDLIDASTLTLSSLI